MGRFVTLAQILPPRPAGRCSCGNCAGWLRFVATRSLRGDPARMLRNGAPCIVKWITARTRWTLNRIVFVRCDRKRLRASACRADPPVMACAPKRERDRHRIELEPIPPCSLVTVPVKLAMMETTNRNRELVADFASERARLCEAKVMCVRRGAAAHHARLAGHEFAVGTLLKNRGARPRRQHHARHATRERSPVRVHRERSRSRSCRKKPRAGREQTACVQRRKAENHITAGRSL
jgi:hypothetical protein